MANYKIFHCPRCRNILYSPHHQKTKQCPVCEKKIDINHQKIIKSAKTIDEAIFFVQNLKLPPELRHLVNNHSGSSHKPKSKSDLFLQLIIKIQKNVKIQSIDEISFLKKAKEAGFSEDWILNQLRDLEINGLLIRPRKDKIQFLL